MLVIFNIQGGLGKNIMATAMTEIIKKKYPDSYLLVVSGYKDVFLNSPFVNKAITHEEQIGIYNNYIKDETTLFMTLDPYGHTDFLNEKEHLFDTWCKLYDLEYNGEKPKMYLSKAEKQYYSSIYDLDKPIMVLQTNGGAANQNMSYNWSRDMPSNLVEQIIDKYKGKYAITHVKRPDQPIYKDTLQALDTYRSIAYLTLISEKRVLIDSFVQHISIAMGKKSVVLWCGTNPNVFGYDENLNLMANHETKIVEKPNISYKRYDLVERIEDIPYNSLDEIYNFEKLTNLINKL